MNEWTLGEVFDAVADAVPERIMTVCGDRRSTFGESAVRTRRFANFLAERGFGAQTEREGLERWECGQDRVAMLMYNDLYPDVLIGCLKARVVPVNINPRYTPQEIRSLLEYIAPRGIVYHRSFGQVVSEVVSGSAELKDSVELLVSVDDGTGISELDGAVSFDEAVAQGDPEKVIKGSPDDLMMMCTGGTTGRPKAVLWRQGDAYVSSMNGSDHESDEPIRTLTALTGQSWFAVSPLSHAAGTWTAFSGLLAGQTVVLYDDRNAFDAQRALEIVEKENVLLMTIVGDAYAGPLVDEMRKRRNNFESLIVIASGGAATNAIHRKAFLELLPNATIVEGTARPRPVAWDSDEAVAVPRSTHSPRCPGGTQCRPTAPESWSLVMTRSDGLRVPVASPSDTSATGTPPKTRSLWSTVSGWRYREIASESRTTGRCGCSAGTLS